MMTTTNLQESINLQINKALGSGLTVAQILVVLNALVTALTGKTYAHDRTIENPDPALNPSQP